MAREKITFTKEDFEITEFNIFDYLKTDEDMAGYLDASLEEGGPEQLRFALNTVIRAKGMTQIAKETGIPQESLYKAFGVSQPPPSDTIRKIAEALGMTAAADRESFSQPPKKAGAAQPKRRRKREPVMA